MDSKVFKIMKECETLSILLNKKIRLMNEILSDDPDVSDDIVNDVVLEFE